MCDTEPVAEPGPGTGQGYRQQGDALLNAGQLVQDGLLQDALQGLAILAAGLQAGPDHPDHRLVQRYMGGRASSILSFGIRGGREVGARFIDALQLAVRLVNIGDAKTLACHPATTTHRQLSPDELAAAGVSEDMVRLSIGIEHIDDIIADIAQAFDAV